MSNLNLFDGNVLYAVPSSTNAFYGWPINPNATTPIGPNGLPLTGAPVSLVAIQQNLPTPVTYRYWLEVQNDFGHNWVATNGYQDSQSRHYTVQNNLNWLFTRLNPMIQNLNYFYNGANASYNSLREPLRRRHDPGEVIWIPQDAALGRTGTAHRPGRFL